MTPAARIRRVEPGAAEPLVPALARLLIACVDTGASVSFMHPLSDDRARAFWQGVAEGVGRHERVLLVAEDAAGALLGTVQIVLALPQNQPHRGDVAKLLVHPHARRQGIAAALMTAVDREARAERRSLLVLDTVTGGDAERLYPRLGWQRCGVIPDFALFPRGGLCSTTVFYKPLPS
jgi:GNAT superfamily N-acetyltransferase